jgi:WXG100 family type VII secretion target
MSISGADLEQLLTLSTKFQSDSHALQQTFTTLNQHSQNSQSYWTGPLANQFREEWNAIQPHLTKIVDLLQKASQATKTHHDNIRAATAGQ